MYDQALTQPMEEELLHQGITALKSRRDVEAQLANTSDFVVFINSVCGCSAGMARPGLIASLQDANCPKVFTVFAGVDRDATNAVRERLADKKPSSPSIAFFKAGKAVHLLERQQIEASTKDALSQWLAQAYEKFYGDPERVQEVELPDLAAVPELSPTELKTLLEEGEDAVILDCRRSQSDRTKATIEGSIGLDDPQVEQLIQHPNPSLTLVCYCHVGNASKEVVRALMNYGLRRVYTLKGGIDAWSQEVDPSVPRY